MDSPRNAIEAVTHADPHPWYRGLRQDRPLFFDEGLGLWVASSHAAVGAALEHAALRVRPADEPVPRALLGTPAGEVFARLVRMNDGDFHAANRPAVEQAARRWSLADVAQAAVQAAQDLRPRLGANAFMAALPAQAMARLLGVPGGQLDATVAWVAQFVRAIAPGASAQEIALGGDAAQALMEQGRAQGLDAVPAANRIAFMQQSVDATSALMGLTALMLAREPELAAQADASLQAMRQFVVEVERHQAPTQNTRRFAAQRLELAGQAIGQGQGVLLVLASANRDEALNPRPDNFEPHRAQPRSMGFGRGRHACPGAALAIELVAACAAWMRATGQFDAYFGAQSGFRPLGNIRAPVFD